MIILRMAKSSDLDAIARLEEEAFGSQAWSYDALEDAFGKYNYRFMVAVDVTETEEIIGYMGMYLVVDEANVTNIAITESYRKRGIGRDLLLKMLSLAKHSNCVAVTLEVRVSNLPAISLYEKSGFSSAGIRKGFYHDPVEDAMIMWNHFALD